MNLYFAESSYPSFIIRGAGDTVSPSQLHGSILYSGYCEFQMFPLCPHGFPPGSPVSSHMRVFGIAQANVVRHALSWTGIPSGVSSPTLPPQFPGLDPSSTMILTKKPEKALSQDE